MAAGGGASRLRIDNKMGMGLGIGPENKIKAGEGCEPAGRDGDSVGVGPSVKFLAGDKVSHQKSLRVYQRSLNRADDILAIIHHLVIPETNHLIPKQYWIGGSLEIMLALLQAAAAIQFNDQFPFHGAEVNNVFAKAMLSSETHPIQLISA